MTQVSFTLLHRNGVLVDRRGGFVPLLHTNPRPRRSASLGLWSF
jgi:hypothetical protein